MLDKLSIQIDKQESGKFFYMLGPKDITIAWQECARYWQLGYILQSRSLFFSLWSHCMLLQSIWHSYIRCCLCRFPEVWILRNVCWLEIHGKIEVVKLSEKSTYVAYLIFQTTENCSGLDVPANSSITFGGKKWRLKCLSSKTKGQ